MSRARVEDRSDPVIEPSEPSEPTRARCARHDRLSRAFARASEDRLRELLARAPVQASSLGGETRVVALDGARVFAKSIPLTDLERLPHHRHSTANLFVLPLHYQYGIGSVGFGAWRELSAHRMASEWVARGECTQLPLLHHWRLLRRDARAPTSARLEELETSVARWGGSAAIRSRLQARLAASADLVLFLEYFPITLDDAYRTQVGRDDADGLRFVDATERDLTATMGFLNRHGLLHFDAHFGNVVTDGARPFVTDFGLALSDRFELSDDERAFHRRHRDYDRALLSANLVAWALPASVSLEERTSLLRDFVSDRHYHPLSRVLEALLKRHAPVAHALRAFNAALVDRDLATPYPEAEIARALALVTSR
ncbi:MAG: protein kinase family protein [Polyangiales bacterium]